MDSHGDPGTVCRAEAGFAKDIDRMALNMYAAPNVRRVDEGAWWWSALGRGSIVETAVSAAVCTQSETRLWTSRSRGHAVHIFRAEHGRQRERLLRSRETRTFERNRRLKGNRERIARCRRRNGQRGGRLEQTMAGLAGHSSRDGGDTSSTTRQVTFSWHRLAP